MNRDWENISNQRYYSVNLIKDLLGDWVITKTWGSKSKRGRTKVVYCHSYENGIKMIEKLSLARKRHGYDLSSI